MSTVTTSGSATGSSRPAEASRAPVGTYLFRAGTPLSQVYVIRSGVVALSRTLPDRRVILRLLGPGDVTGDIPLLRGIPAPFDAVALSDVTFTALPASRFLWALDNEPEFARRTMLSLAERLSAWQHRVADLLSGDLRTQIASLLVHELDGRPNVRLTQQWLADLVGARRSSVSRVLHQLARQGLIDLGYRCVGVVDRPGLAAVARGAGLEVEAGSAGVAGAIA